MIMEEAIKGMFRIPEAEGDDSPVAISKHLLQECPEFQHLVEGEAEIAFLLAAGEVIKNGKQVLGMAHMPTVQGQLKGVFSWMLVRVMGFDPDFLITLDLEFWESASERDREILVYHELCHCVQKVDREGEPRWSEDGLPVWGIVDHDVNEFVATVRRYGAYSEEIREFIAAAGEK